MTTSSKQQPISDVTLEARGFMALELDQGQVMRVEDIEGEQCSDIVFYNRHNYDERYSPSYTVNLNKHIYLGLGCSLYSTLANKLMTITADTVGRHDCICGSCSFELNRLRYGDKAKGKRTCRENLEDALAPYGIGATDIPHSFNNFMNFSVAETGDVSYGVTVSKPGDYIDMTADMDVLVGVSNCPQELNEANGYNPTALRVAVFGASS